MFVLIGAKTKNELVNKMNEMRIKACHKIEKSGISFEAIVELSDKEAKEYQAKLDEAKKENDRVRLERLKANGLIEEEVEEVKESEEK